MGAVWSNFDTTSSNSGSGYAIGFWTCQYSIFNDCNCISDGISYAMGFGNCVGSTFNDCVGEATSGYAAVGFWSNLASIFNDCTGVGTGTGGGYSWSNGYGFYNNHSGSTFDTCSGEGYATGGTDVNQACGFGMNTAGSGSDFIDCAKNVIRKDNDINGSYYISLSYNEMILKNKEIVAYKIQNENFFPLDTPEAINRFTKYMTD